MYMLEVFEFVARSNEKVHLLQIHYQEELQVADVVVVLQGYSGLPVFLGQPFLRLHQMHERMIVSILL